MADSASKKGVLVVDDHPLVREGLAAIVAESPDLCIIGQCGLMGQVMLAVRALSPDLVVMDVDLGGETTLGLMEEIRKLRPSLPILALSWHDEALYAERTLRAGAAEYLSKEARPAKIIETMNRLLRLGAYVSDGDGGRRPELSDGRAREAKLDEEFLSERELQVFKLVGRGYGAAQIAEQLELSRRTVESHLANIRRKLNIDTPHDLLQRAIVWSQTGAAQGQ